MSGFTVNPLGLDRLSKIGRKKSGAGMVLAVDLLVRDEYLMFLLFQDHWVLMPTPLDIVPSVLIG